MRTLLKLGVLSIAMAALMLAGCSEPPGFVGWKLPDPARRPAPPSSDPPYRDPPDSRFSPGARDRRANVFARAKDDHAWRRLGEPRAGDWLHRFREPGQTVIEHWRSLKNKKTKRRDKLHIQPFGDLSPAQRAIFPDVQQHLRAFFDSPVVELPTRAIDRSWVATERLPRQQYDANRIANALLPMVPSDSLGLLGLVGRDLFFDDLNFVFGIGRFEVRVGVHSLHRYGTERQLLRERAVKLASHELGHMFGIEHCVFYDCVMNGVNSRQELDESSPHLCPVCHEKLRRALQFKAKARYRKLEESYRALGMSDAADFVAARAR